MGRYYDVDAEIAKLRAVLDADKPKQKRNTASPAKATRSRHLKMLGNAASFKVKCAADAIGDIIESDGSQKSIVRALQAEADAFDALHSIAEALANDLATAHAENARLKAQIGRDYVLREQRKRAAAIVAGGDVEIRVVTPTWVHAFVTDAGGAKHTVDRKGEGADQTWVCSCGGFDCTHQHACQLVTVQCDVDPKTASASAAPLVASSGALTITSFEAGTLGGVEVRAADGVHRLAWAGFGPGGRCSCGASNAECIGGYAARVVLP